MLHGSRWQFPRNLLRRKYFAAVGALLFAELSIGASAQTQREQRVVPEAVSIDWTAASRDASGLLRDPTLPETPNAQRRAQVGEGLRSFSAQAGQGMALPFPAAFAVPIPILLPLDNARFLVDGSGIGQDKGGKQAFWSPTIESIQFLPGPSGYDALLTVSRKALSDLHLVVVHKPQVHLAGSALSYDQRSYGDPVPELQAVYPDLRRWMSDDEVTYSFRKYGVPYFANLGCLPGPQQPGRLACDQAEAILRVMLADLRIVGGQPINIKPRVAPTVPRPTKASSMFRYYPPGKLLSGTSQGNAGGDTSRNLYGGGSLNFPIKTAPVYANSQVFMHSGYCLEQKVDILDHPDDKFDRYKCRQNPTLELLDFEGHPDNYSYPWRDTYCEARLDANTVPTGCPTAMPAHAGQDLRPPHCFPVRAKGSRCKIDVFEVIAVDDGYAWWKTGNYENHLRLVVNNSSDHLYFMYLHMSPSSLWNAGMLRSDVAGGAIPVTKGQVIGLVSNFDKSVVAGTSTHLHFEIRHGQNVGPTVSPYWTLVRAYERLINARGKEILN